MQFYVEGTGATTAIAGSSSARDAVLNFYRNVRDGDEGTDYRKLYGILSQYPQPVIEREVKSLLDEGHIYVTIDDYHVKFVHL